MPPNSEFVDISCSPTSSLEFLARFDRLRVLNASNTSITDLQGALISATLRSVSFRGTSFAARPHYRVMVLCALAPSAVDIDSDLVSQD
jgi:hypothetical protein